MADHKQEGRESPRSESLHRERYTISKDFDHILVIIPSSIITRFVNGVFEERRGPPQAAYEFEVKLEALHKIDYFRRTLPLDKAEHSTSELLDDDPHAWAIWLRLVHECLENKDYKAQVSTVWHVLRIADKYGIDPKRADSGKWFDEWFFTQSALGYFVNDDVVRQILFPCHAFDHALGFATSTMWLAYHCTGHIAEKRPYDFEGHERLGLDRGIEQQLNAARGRLKSILHRQLYDCVDELLGYAQCKFRKDVLWGYFTALNRTRSWPLERFAKRYSIQQLLDNLEAFNYDDPHPKQPCWDYSCGQDFTWVVTKAIEVTGSHFEGLCLDCMKAAAQGKNAKKQFDFRDPKVDWSEGCRVTHGESTWYHSTMGRVDKGRDWALK